MENRNYVGIISQVDDLGRIIIPKEIRRAMGIIEGECVEIFATGSQEIVLRRATVQEKDGILVKVDTHCSTPPTAPDAPIRMYFQNEYDSDDIKRMIVTPAQKRVIDYLSSCDLLNADYDYREGEPECEWDDLTK